MLTTIAEESVMRTKTVFFSVGRTENSGGSNTVATARTVTKLCGNMVLLTYVNSVNSHPSHISRQHRQIVHSDMLIWIVITLHAESTLVIKLHRTGLPQ